MQVDASTAAGASRSASLSRRVLGVRPRHATAAALFCGALALVGQARALDLEVMVTLQSVNWTNCDDEVGPPGIYHRVTIAGVTQTSAPPDPVPNFSFETGLDEQFTRSVDHSLGTIDIVIEQWDDDSGEPFGGADDMCRISPDDNPVTFSLDLAACLVSGEVNGVCGQTFTLSDPSLSSNPLIEFKVEVQEPASSPGLNVRCIHDPIWPQPGQTVTIRAEALDGALAPKLANSVQIWADSRALPAINTPGVDASFMVTPAMGATELNYGCKIVDGAEVAWTGWRKVAIGQPAVVEEYDRKIPIMYTGPRPSSLDFVFYHDRDNWALPDNPTFLADLKAILTGAFMQDELFLRQQHKMNYWIAVDGGETSGDGSGCEIEVANQAHWEDASVILHTDNFRDCAYSSDRTSSSLNTAPHKVRHESGHVPFGLADEYPGDGGYFQAFQLPNVYHSLNSIGSQPWEIGCIEDAANVGRMGSDCREFQEVVPWWFDNTWYTSDPETTPLPPDFIDDIMSDFGPIRALDLRRMEWVYSNCSAASC